MYDDRPSIDRTGAGDASVGIFERMGTKWQFEKLCNYRQRMQTDMKLEQRLKGRCFMLCCSRKGIGNKRKIWENCWAQKSVEH